jgi:hypothetical protein
MDREIEEARRNPRDWVPRTPRGTKPASTPNDI